jgi:hypothetical protein
MRVDIDQDKTQIIVKALLGVAVVLGALILVKVAGYFVAASKAEAIAARTGRRSTDGNDLGQQLAQAKTSADQLKKKNLFVRTPPKEHPVKEVTGILGSEALINDKWYKAGDSVGDAKIVAVEPTKVRIAWDGQEKEFTPIGSSGAGGPGAPPGRQVTPNRKRGPSSGAPMVVAGPRRSAGRGGPGGISSEERERLRQRWQNMSPEERQRLREDMRSRFGGRNR